MTSPFKRVEPKWWSSRGSWLVRHGGHTTQFPPIPGSRKPPPEALAFCDTYNAALETGGLVLNAETGTLAAAIEIFCKDLERRRDEEQSITAKYCRDTQRNARSWYQVRDGWEGSGRTRKPKFTPRMYKGKKIASLFVGDLEVVDVQSIFADLDGEHKTKKNKIEALRCAIDHAVNLGWCKKIFACGGLEKSNTSNVARAVKHERSKYAKTVAEIETGKVVEHISVPDISALCDKAATIDQPVYKKDGTVRQVAWCDGIALIFAIHMGLRFSEQAALKWKFVDFDDNVVHVRTAVREGEGGIQEVGVTKTEQSRRSVPMTPTMRRLLAEWKMRSPWSGDDDIVFPTREGNRQASSDNWRTRVLHPACDSLSMSRFTWHQLRHLFASLAIAMKKPTSDQRDDVWAELATKMGHNTPKETFKTYVHYIKNVKKAKDWGDGIESLLRGVA